MSKQTEGWNVEGTQKIVLFSIFLQVIVSSHLEQYFYFIFAPKCYNQRALLYSKVYL